MEVKPFECTINGKPLWVGISLEKEGEKNVVKGIQFEMEGKNEDGIPKNPTFEEVDGEWMLKENTVSNVNGSDMDVSQVIDNEHTQFLIKRIIRERDAYIFEP